VSVTPNKQHLSISENHTTGAHALIEVQHMAIATHLSVLIFTGSLTKGAATLRTKVICGLDHGFHDTKLVRFVLELTTDRVCIKKWH
jgi:hypothetical protein